MLERNKYLSSGALRSVPAGAVRFGPFRAATYAVPLPTTSGYFHSSCVDSAVDSADVCMFALSRVPS